MVRNMNDNNYTRMTEAREGWSWGDLGDVVLGMFGFYFIIALFYVLGGIIGR